MTGLHACYYPAHERTPSPPRGTPHASHHHRGRGHCLRGRRRGAYVCLRPLRLRRDAQSARVESLPRRGTGLAMSTNAFQTIMFTDMEGHTSMMGRLGDVRGREVTRQYERITRECLREYGGIEVKS